MLQRRRYFPSEKISLAICVLFLVSIFAAPSGYLKIANTVTEGIMAERDRSVPLSLLTESKTYMISEVSANEFLNDLRITMISSRNTPNYQNIILNVLNILLPFVSFCLLVYCFGYFNRRKIRHKSIMAFSIGGHAPPRISLT